MGEDAFPGVQSIRCEQGPEGLRMVRLEWGSARVLADRGLGPGGSASVHLVRAKSLPQIRVLGEVFDDCGKKHPARPLSAILLGRDRIPVLDGGFKNAGQLVRGLKALLRNAGDVGDRNRFVVGVAESVFDRLWAQADAAASRAGAGAAEPPLSFESLLEILPQREVPPELEAKVIGISPQIRFTRQLILQAAQHDGPVLILGDTGTGKDLVARSIHACSDRAEMQFIPVNCGAIPRDLLESELFGHKKGSFTGAHADKTGLWMAANRGVLFLDEVGDLPPEHQVKVLGALDNKRIRSVGSNVEIPVDVRVIAATNRDLPAMMERGQFRPDLYYRLRSFMIYTEPLSKHPEDVPLLARHFWSDIVRHPKAALSDDIIEMLQANPWAGNVRDLKWTLVGLYRYTGQVAPTLKQLKTVVWYENQRGFSRAAPYDKPGIDAHRVECLMHLRRTDDALRACEVALRPMSGGKRVPRTMMAQMADVLRRHAGELELLCLHPLLFADGGTFRAVDQFKWGVVDFLHVLQVHPAKARDAWDNPLSRLLQQATNAVFQQVARMVKGK